MSSSVILHTALLTIALFIYGCAGPGVYHTVKGGETFWRICKTYGVEMQEVAEMNNITNPAEIKAGRRIFIPGASRVREVKPYAPPSPGAKEEGGRISFEKGRFEWPVKGEVISAFGQRNGVRHGGIDIRANEGAPVYASDAGEVVYAESDLKGYGRIIILKHRSDFYTVYAHNSENLVKKGEQVGKGAKIATVGSSGNASTPHLHFEVRQGKTVRNPLFFLP